jgi:hypothetical protein
MDKEHINCLNSWVSQEKRMLRNSGIPRKDRIPIIKQAIEKRCVEEFGVAPTDDEFDKAFHAFTKVKFNGRKTQRRVLKIPYKQYLRSPHWIRLKRFIFKQRGHRCEQCGQRTSVELHHLTYENVTHERECDVILLCRQCHEDFHKNNKIPPMPVSISLMEAELAGKYGLKKKHKEKQKARKEMKKRIPRGKSKQFT